MEAHWSYAMTVGRCWTSLGGVDVDDGWVWPWNTDACCSIGVFLLELPKSDAGSDSVVEKDVLALGLRSTREVSKVMLTDVGSVILDTWYRKCTWVVWND